MNKAFEKILERLESAKDGVCERSTCECTDECCFVDGINKSKEIVQEVAEEHKEGWIPCSERLPEEYGEYLIWWTDIIGNQYYEITEYEPVSGWIGDIPQAVEGKYSVIAWQPLPEPYQPKGE